MKNKSTT